MGSRRMLSQLRVSGWADVAGGWVGQWAREEELYALLIAGDDS